jgi:hypothetical protein
MFGRVLRGFVVLATTLVVLALARPALAAPALAGQAQAAPFCDDRGATGLAAPPALEAPDEAVWRVRACGHAASGIDALLPHFTPSHHVAPAAEGDDAGACVAHAVNFEPVPSHSGWNGEAASVRPPSAARSRLERPPRG